MDIKKIYYYSMCSDTHVFSQQFKKSIIFKTNTADIFEYISYEIVI